MNKNVKENVLFSFFMIQCIYEKNNYGDYMKYKNYSEINKDTYNNVAKELVNRHKKLGKNEPSPKNYYDKILSYINNTDSIKYLELGPGDGNVLKYFASKNIQTYAIENSESMIKLCKKQSPNSKIIEDNILNVNFDSDTFDIIFAGSFIHLFPKKDLKIVMNKIYKWLNKDGIFFSYTTLHEQDKEGYFSKEKNNYSKENIRFRHQFTSESLNELFIKNNFSILEHYQITEPENDRIWQFIIAAKKK